MGSSRHKGYRFPREIIAHCVWLYHRFTLAFREIELLMAARGIEVTYETMVKTHTETRRRPLSRELFPGSRFPYDRGFEESGAQVFATPSASHFIDRRRHISEERQMPHLVLTDRVGHRFMWKARPRRWGNDRAMRARPTRADTQFRCPD